MFRENHVAFVSELLVPVDGVVGQLPAEVSRDEARVIEELILGDIVRRKMLGITPQVDFRRKAKEEMAKWWQKSLDETMMKALTNEKGS